jgi:hypothetical protein
MYPKIIGPLDSITKIFSKECGLQKRIHIALVLAECDTQSAEWLLPKNRKISEILSKVIYQFFTSFIKITFGLFLLIIPNFIKKNAR